MKVKCIDGEYYLVSKKKKHKNNVELEKQEPNKKRSVTIEDVVSAMNFVKTATESYRLGCELGTELGEVIFGMDRKEFGK